MKPTPTPDVVNLVVAAREFWDANNDLSEESRALDKALEPFSGLVPYENGPDDAALSVQAAAAVVGEPVAYLRQADGSIQTPKYYAALLPGQQAKYTPLYAAPSAPDGWQPIETAPKDGTTLWVLDELYGKPWHYECNWNGIEWYHGFGVAWPDARPTHWRPLPAPPALGGSHE